MGKNEFFILINIIVIISCGKVTKKLHDLNNLRKLEIELNQTILIGFDNYKENRNNGDKTLTLSFNTYFLANRLNGDTEDFWDSFPITSIITNSSQSSIVLNFNCSKVNEYRYCYYTNNNDNNEDYKNCIVKYNCEINNMDSSFQPTNINLTVYPIQIEQEVYYKSPFAVAFQNDLTKMKNKEIFNRRCNQFLLLQKAKITEHNGNFFKIRGNLYGWNNYYNWECDPISNVESENILLIAMNDERPATIQCKGYYAIDKEDDKQYYYLETTGINQEVNSTLQYSIAYFTKQNKTIMLDFDSLDESKIIKKQLYKKTSGGLSTGGIIAVIIPCIIILLGVAGLVFFLLKKPAPPVPLKNMPNNNTIGIGSSEGVVPK